jgi:[acyl-carrier-protein] S-malonyltransferase
MLDHAPEHEALGRLLDGAEALADLELRTIAALGSAEDLADTRVAQPLLYLADWAWGRALVDSGLRPDVVAGHSLGEFAALAIAEVFSVEAGLELVVERSRLMATAAVASPGSMAAVLGLPTEQVIRIVESISDVWVANDNAEGQVVISGASSAVSAASAELTGAGARRVVPLKVSGAFHSPLMEPARARFAETLLAAEFTDARIPVSQNTGPEPLVDAGAIRDRLMAQITAPVRWREIVESMAADGPILMIEAGPGTVLTGLAKRVEGVSAFAADDVGIEAIMERVW